MLILTTIVAIATFLTRAFEPVGSGSTSLIGLWDGGQIRIDIWPDGAFSVYDRGRVFSGPVGCMLKPQAEQDRFLLSVDGRKLIDVHYLADEKGSFETFQRGFVELQRCVLTKTEFWTGAYRHGMPHGLWVARDRNGNIIRQVEYRDGIVDGIRDGAGQPQPRALEMWRSRRGQVRAEFNKTPFAIRPR